MTIKEAVIIATNYFTELYDGRYTNLALEEVERSEGGGSWYIKLGYDVKIEETLPLPGLTPRTERKYKIFEINIGTEEVVSMKIRKV